MFTKKKKIIAIMVAVLVLSLSFSTTSFAASISATLNAQFKALKILLNGQQVTMESQPIIVNGSTYLPLRAFANLFNKNVDWNATLQQVTITDKPDNLVTSLQAQIKEKDNQILVLQTQLAAKSGGKSLSDMEKQLNRDYEDYEKMDVSITLSGSTSKITVKVDIGDEDDWDDLSSTKQTKLLQYIADDLNDEYDDPDISGTVRDGSTTLKTFTVNSSGTVKISSSSSSLSNFADELEDDYDELGDIDKLSISLSGSTSGTITFTVKIKYSSFEDEWDELDDDEIEDFMLDIQGDIEDEYDDADVKGYIKDSSDSDANMASLSTSGSFKRYSDYD
ncbi:copper amine oxidase N-terminal domain-containing protein [Candidatus Formimonas warabiya]|uniref:Copper amine oxidase-like N-terminal domain-containing protein n=1 Tax=Formimonas warabiya TaxID=1761012 RepID=A0A3G1KU98_FORW1|nr:copper amine oxidase N-terminal domain-containing protein [Candidatus Formimonas warabiya]ATW26016.1 hypothetical protein DCMF_15640 [Candidatus Formimonas warabiya]